MALYAGGESVPQSLSDAIGFDGAWRRGYWTWRKAYPGQGLRARLPMRYGIAIKGFSGRSPRLCGDMYATGVYCATGGIADMKSIFFTVLAILFCASSVWAAKEVAQPFSLERYGSLKRIIQEKDLDGVVSLEEALAGPHVYAVGMIAGAAGEITVIDGDASLNYGKSGIGNPVTEIRKGDEAALLIVAHVGRWRTVPIPENMTEVELHGFVLEEARKSGVNTREPFPFLIEGTIRKLVWSVLDGTDPELTRQTHQLFFRKLVGYRAEANAVLLGFYPAELQSELAWPGEWWHVHVLFRNEKTTGHVNAFSVEKGALLRLPARLQPELREDNERASIIAPRRGTRP